MAPGPLPDDVLSLPVEGVGPGVRDGAPFGDQLDPTGVTLLVFLRHHG